MTHTATRRTVMGVAAVALAVGLVGCNGTAQNASGGKTVTIGYIAWDECVASSYLWKELLERQGYTVRLKRLELASLYSGVASGQLDVFLCATPKTHSDHWARFGKKFTVAGQWYDHLAQGIAVPNYVPISSTAQLKGMEEQLGRKIVGIEAGSGLMRQTHNNAVKDYGLDGYKVVDGNTPAMLAALDSALSQKKPIAVTLWQPHWAFTKYPIKLLKDPKGSFGRMDVYKVIISKQFASKNKTVSNELSTFHMTLDQLGSLELEITNPVYTARLADPQQPVRAWISRNESVVEDWTAGKD